MSLFDYAAGAPLSAPIGISQQVIDEILADGGNEPGSALRICARFKMDRPMDENAAWLQREYRQGGKGFIIGGEKIAVWFDPNGIHIAEGETAIEAGVTVDLTWEQAAKRIRELLDLGRYLPQKQLLMVDANERDELADMLCMLERDVSIDFFIEKEAFRGSFPESKARVSEMLRQPERLREIRDGMEALVERYRREPEVLRARYHRLEEMLTRINGLAGHRLTFHAERLDEAGRKQFITKDEMDAVLIGGDYVQHGKFRIYSFFLQPHTLKEKADFLKHEYGIGGYMHLGYNENHDGKGISLSQGSILKPYDKVLMKWPAVARRIDELIAAGRYMSERELAYIPEYEKHEIARSIAGFFQGKSREDNSPFLPGMDMGDAIELARPFLDDPNKIAEILDQMRVSLALMQPDDRHYAYDMRAYNDLLAYSEGRFSLFQPSAEAPASPQQAPAQKAETEQATETQSGNEAIPPYAYHLNDIVELGDKTYTIVGVYENNVLLHDPDYPLLQEDMARDVFERRLHDNRANDRLIVNVDTAKLAEQGLYDESADTDETDFDEEYDEALSRFAVVETELDADHPYAIWDEVYESLCADADGDELSFATEEEAEAYVEQLETELVEEEAVARQETEEQNAAVHPLTPTLDQSTEVKLKSVVIDLTRPRVEKHDFRITDDELGHGGPKAKYRMNVDAIRTLQAIESEHRLATPDEQEVLSRYVGWGGVADAFDESKENWRTEYAELKGLLTEKEYESARASVLNAHYTSPTVIKAMYTAIESMGFRTGNVLEPACGIGNFFGLVPESMKSSKLYGIELDSITGRIAKQLYQSANIAVQGYEDSSLPDSFFDVAIGNVPFGGYGVLDKRYDKNHFMIHDYFFAKTLDKVRPGGVVAFVTSSGTMDKKNPSVRKYLAERAELLGAIRLPNNAFLQNAGTEVVADILFLQKRDRPMSVEPDWVHLGRSADGFAVNQYFADHPEMILGELTEERTQYGKQACTVRPIPGADLAEQLKDAIADIHGTITEYERDDALVESTDESIPADPNVRNFSFAVVNGKIYYRENSRMTRMEVSVTAENRIRGMVEIRDCTRKLIEYQLDGTPDEIIGREQKSLTRLYDSFTKKYGLLNSRGNKMAFSDDSSYPLLCSLEVLDENGNLLRKADMFSKRTIRQHTEIISVDTATEALAVSLAEKARVDLPYMAKLTGKTEEQVIADLKGIIFLNIGGTDNQDHAYVTADEYLSGNIRRKLDFAIAAQQAVNNGAFDANVEALRSVLPNDLTASEIDVRLGATWLPPEIVEQFVIELLKPNGYAQNKLHVHYSSHTATWNIEGKNNDYGNVQAGITHGTKRINAYKIIEETLNLKDVRIFDTVLDADGKEQSVLNKKETILAQQKQQGIKDAFREWIWADPARREKLTRLYNDRFNSTRPREYDGNHLTFPGMNPAIELRQHQKNAVARAMYGGNSLYAHVVGAGKTFTMVATAMESKRLGLAQKSLMVVPNHLTEQWASEFLQLYPSANILVATKKDFEPHNRKKFCSRISTGDYDAVIIGHSQFEKIPVSAERQKAMLEQELWGIVAGIAEAKKANAERFTIKQMEKTRKSIKLKLDKLNEQSRKDDVVTFEELGVDRLFVDEAHFYKNLAVVTKMRNVAGLSQTEAQKSSDLYMKCRYMDELTGGRGIVFATGTPISNSMVEMYTLQRYLQYETLKARGLLHFDEWASTFGETVTSIELAPEGTGYRAKTRFARFYNLPELIGMYKEVADVQTADMLNLPVPEVEYVNAAMKPSEYQRDMVASLAERAERIRNGMVEPTEDNMLKVTNDGRKLALDQRLANNMLPDNPNSKVRVCMENVLRTWDENRDKRLTQMVFCDLSIPKGDGGFNVYDDLKSKLIACGVPEHEIAYIHDAKTEVQKAALFTKVRAGQVRILIGSTAKMGAGTNVQRLLKAEHHLDIPWRPSDIEQREGRMIRQGNTNENVKVFRYVTENTFDAYMWQTIENKQKFIGQIQTSKSPVRSCEDIDEVALSFAEVKALATGNPYIKEKMDLEVAVSRLKLLKSDYLSQKYALEDSLIKYWPQCIRATEKHIAGDKADIALYEQHRSEDFPGMTLLGRSFAEKKEAGAELIAVCKAQTDPAQKEIGAYMGFTLLLAFDIIGKQFKLTLKGERSHTIELGDDIHGNIQRMDNALAAIPMRLAENERALVELHTQAENAKAEAEKPFAQELELKQKSARLAELDTLLNMDKRENDTLDVEPEQEEEKERVYEAER